MTTTADHFISIPRTVLPGGRVVEPFEVAKYLASKQADGKAGSKPGTDPWIHIGYLKANQAAKASGLRLMTLSERLAVALHLAACDQNWTEGKIGKGMLKRGRWALSAAEKRDSQLVGQARTFHFGDGQTIMDFAGYCHEWVFDDIHGDDHGLVRRLFEAQDESLVIPYPEEQRGQGATPKMGANWIGLALRCGGSANPMTDTCGLFNLSGLWPYNSGPDTSFRCVRQTD